jgi:ubiquinone/menaquinone biosynthesis C-methylase UbiE
VLEIGSGTGDHTNIILNTGAEVTALDISPSSLQVLRLRHPTIAKTITANMESLPFRSDEFDAVISCASLSYGNFRLVSSEIYRVLKPGGKLIVLDTLANNPIFMLIRIRHVLFRRRSLKTLVNMPSLRCIRALENQYQSGRTTFFGFFFPFIGNTRKPIDSILVYPSKFLTYLNEKLENSRFRFLCHKFIFIGTKPHSNESN